MSNKPITDAATSKTLTSKTKAELIDLVSLLESQVSTLRKTNEDQAITITHRDNLINVREQSIEGLKKDIDLFSHKAREDQRRINEQGAEIETLKERIKTIEEEKTSLNNSLEIRRKQVDKTNDELEQIHSFIDTLEGAMGREHKVSDTCYGNTNPHPVTRLASWFASRIGK